MQRLHFVFGMLGGILIAFGGMVQTPVYAGGIEYNPPAVGAPDSRVGAGTRGPARGPARGFSRGLTRGEEVPCRSQAEGARGFSRGAGDADEAEKITLAVLGPGHQAGRTAHSQPTLYWGVVNACDYDEVEIILRERVSNPFAAAKAGSLIDTRIKGPADGIHTLSLADHNVNLEAGKEYEWAIALVVDPNNRSLDVVAMTTIERIDADTDLQQQLAGAGDDLDKAGIYAQQGIWYDAVQALYNANGASADALRKALFQQVELPEVIASLPRTQ